MAGNQSVTPWSSLKLSPALRPNIEVADVDWLLHQPISDHQGRFTARLTRTVSPWSSMPILGALTCWPSMPDSDGRIGRGDLFC
jgi:hypothetical protein